MQVAASVLGIVVMVATAALISWYKRIEGRSPGFAAWSTRRRCRSREEGMRTLAVALICALASGVASAKDSQ